MSIQLLTVPEAGEKLRVSPNTVLRLIALGKLRAVDVAATGRGTRTRVRDDDLQAYINANTRRTQAS